MGLEKVPGPVPEQSDFKKPKKSSKSAKSSKSKSKKTKMTIIDEDFNPWNDIHSKDMIDADRVFADVGGDAPQIVTFEKNNKSENSENKWKKSDLTERFDSSSSNDSDSDADVDRNGNDSKSNQKEAGALRYDSDSDDSDDSDIDVRDAGSKSKKSKKSAHIDIPDGQAATVFRDKSGRRHNVLAQRQADQEKAEKRLAKEDKWKSWGKGLTQGKAEEAEVEGSKYEVSKPLARYADDKDLADYQKSIKRLNDPMEKFFIEKAEKRRKKAGGMPIYKGSWDQNRYNVRPGHRWDGVDRGNGFEKRFYRRASAKTALKEFEVAYMTEDM